MQLFLFLELISMAITVTVTGFYFSRIIIIPVMSIISLFFFLRFGGLLFRSSFFWGGRRVVGVGFGTGSLR